MLISYRRGQGSIVLRVKILNSSVSTGAGLTGLTSASSGLIISTIADNEASATAYTVAGSTIESITTLGTFAAPTATKCRFKEVDATNHKGVYEIQIADARYAVSAAKSLVVSISGATNAAETDVTIPLTDLDPYDVVRHGATALPNVVSGNAGALLVDGTGTAAVSTAAGKLLLQATQTGVTIPTVTSVGSVSGAVASVTGNVGGNVTGSVGSVASGGISSSSFASGAITAAAIAADAIGASELASDAVAEIQSGLMLAASYTAPDNSGIAAIKVKTDNLPSDPADASDIASSFSAISSALTTIAGYIDTEVAAIKAKTDQLAFSGSGVQADAVAIGGSAPVHTSGKLWVLDGDGNALPTSAQNATAVLAAGDVDGFTLEQALKIVLASAAGKLSGAGTATITIRSADDTVDRIVATISSNNRTAVTLNGAG